MYDGPVELPRENTNTCFFEFTATPAISPKWTSSGMVSGSGTDSNGSCGTDWAADGRAAAATRSRARRTRLTVTSKVLKAGMSHATVRDHDGAAKPGSHAGPPPLRHHFTSQFTDEFDGRNVAT